MKVLVATSKPFAKIAVDGIREVIEGAGFELALLEKYTEKSALLAAVADADAIIIRSDIIDAEVFDAAKQLKIVVRAGAGYDNVDLASATAHGVCVMNTPGQNANAVAELVAGLMVYAVRNFYNGTSGIELLGKKLGIHAFGNVGRNVARIAKGFGMDVYAFDAYCPKEVIEAAGVHAVDNVEDMYKTCQFQHHSSKASILRCLAFFTVQLSHPHMTTGKTTALTRQTFVGKVMSLLLNMLSRLVITFLPRSKRLLISWLQSPSAVILEPPKKLSLTLFPHLFLMK